MTRKSDPTVYALHQLLTKSVQQSLSDLFVPLFATPLDPIPFTARDLLMCKGVGRVTLTVILQHRLRLLNKPMPYSVGGIQFRYDTEGTAPRAMIYAAAIGRTEDKTQIYVYNEYGEYLWMPYDHKKMGRLTICEMIELPVRDPHGDSKRDMLEQGWVRIEDVEEVYVSMTSALVGSVSGSSREHRARYFRNWLETYTNRQHYFRQRFPK